METVHLPAPPMTPTPPPRPAPPSGGRFTGSTGRRRTTQRRAPTPGRKHVVLEESSSPVTIPMSTINAPAVTSPEAKQDGAIQLEECLSALLQPETMTGNDAPRCDVCSSRVGRQRTIRVESHPRVLILHLKRFVYELGDNPMDGYTPKRVDDELVIPRSLHVPGMAAKPKQSQQSHPPQPASPSRLIFGLLGANRNTPSTPSTPKTPQIGATYELHAVAHHEGCLQVETCRDKASTAQPNYQHRNTNKERQAEIGIFFCPYSGSRVDRKFLKFCVFSKIRKIPVYHYRER